MLLDLIDIEKVRRAIIYLGLILAAVIVQDVILSRLPLMGVRVMVLPVAVVAVGFFEGGVWGAVYGLILGILGDMSFSVSSITFTVLFPLMGFASGVLAAFFVNKRFFSFFFICFFMLLVTAFCQLFRFLVFTDTNTVPLLVTGGLQTLWALPFTPLFYYPCRSISRLDLTR